MATQFTKVQPVRQARDPVVGQDQAQPDRQAKLAKWELLRLISDGLCACTLPELVDVIAGALYQAEARHGGSQVGSLDRESDWISSVYRANALAVISETVLTRDTAANEQGVASAIAYVLDHQKPDWMSQDAWVGAITYRYMVARRESLCNPEGILIAGIGGKS